MSPWMGVLAACGIALRFRNPWKNPRRDFSKAGSGNGIPCLPYNTELWRVADYSREIARREIENGSGTQFAPKYAKIMLEMIDEDKEYKMKE